VSRTTRPGAAILLGPAKWFISVTCKAVRRNERESRDMARILVVDDEEQVRGMLRKMLERAGHEVIDAPDGNVAARLYRENPADLMIVDVLMPEKDGLETIIDLRGDFPDAKIIAMSGGGITGRLDLLPAAKHLGAACTLKKPFKRQELVDTIERVLADAPEATDPAPGQDE